MLPELANVLPSRDPRRPTCCCGSRPARAIGSDRAIDRDNLSTMVTNAGRRAAVPALEAALPPPDEVGRLRTSRNPASGPAEVSAAAAIAAAGFVQLPLVLARARPVRRDTYTIVDAAAFLDRRTGHCKPSSFASRWMTRLTFRRRDFRVVRSAVDLRCGRLRVHRCRRWSWKDSGRCEMHRRPAPPPLCSR